jgi:two-component system sensor kinase FixL
MRRFLQKREPEPEPVSVNQAVQDALALATAGDVDQLELGVDLDLDPADPHVLADRVEIQQLIFNLIRNAIEAMTESPRKELHIGTAVVGGDVEISVRDRGPGLAIDGEDLFTPFLTTKSDGLGLGLAICRSIADRRGGRISARGNAEGGALFCVMLPHADGLAARRSFQDGI